MSTPTMDWQACGTCDAKPGEACRTGCRAWLNRLFGMCTAHPFHGATVCTNPADGPDGACEVCRDEMADREEWADEREAAWRAEDAGR